MRDFCEHLSTLTDVQIGQYVCEECTKTGSVWVHLRTCQSCGKTHCCDSSPNRHATEHFHTTQHPVIASAEPGERWLWCCKDERIRPY